CATALGLMKDETSINKLEQMAQSNAPYVRIAALKSLYHLGKKEKSRELMTIASEGNIFAIASLSEVPESKDLLFRLCQHDHIQIRTNAALSLLEHQDSRCLPSLVEVLFRDSRDLAFMKTTSPSKALSAW